MLGCVPPLEEAVTDYLRTAKEEADTRAALEQLGQQLQYVEAALDQPGHTAYSLHHR